LCFEQRTLLRAHCRVRVGGPTQLQRKKNGCTTYINEEKGNDATWQKKREDNMALRFTIENIDEKEV